MIRAKNYNLLAIFLIAISFTAVAFVSWQFATNTGKIAPKQELAQLSKDKKPKLKPGKVHVQASNALVLSEEQENDLPVVYKSGTLSSSETWEAGYVYYISTGVTVPEGVILNLSAGSIVKLGSWGSSITVNDGGTLNASGTSSSPVFITSYRDDTIGGDTNGDGSSTTPSIGDYGTGINNYGTTNLSFTGLKYGANAIAGGNYTGTHLQISDCDFSYSYVAIGAYAESALLERNNFNVDPGVGNVAVALFRLQDISGVVLSGANKNLFTGNGPAKTVAFHDSILPSTKTMTADSTSGAIVKIDSYYDSIRGTLNIGNNVILLANGYGVKVSGTLNLSAGSIVKLGSWGSSITVNDGGHFNANGTSSSFVSITSYKDDAAGGDTNGDGSSTTPSIGDYGTGINNYGNATASFANFKYGSNPISGGNSTSNITILDSTFSNSVMAIDVRAQTVTLERNSFDVNPGVGNVALALSNVQDISGVVLSGANKNIFVGGIPSKSITFYDSILPSSKTMTVGAESGAVLNIDSYSDSIKGTLNVGTGVLLITKGYGVKVSGTLNLSAGSIVKLGSWGSSITVNDGGTLNASGTSSSPVFITSYRDDTIGGDTNGDGSSTTPSIGDYGTGINAPTNANVNIEYSTIRYASSAYVLGGQIDLDNVTVQHTNNAFSVYNGEAQLTGILVDDADTALAVSQGAVTFRGSLNDISNKGITACNWGGNCSVDASYTDWGNAAGPNTSSQTLVCGQVSFAPWRDGSNTVNGGLFGSGNCDGSPTPGQRVNSATTNFSSRMAAKGIDCSNGFQDACDAIQTAQNCLGAATSLAASTSSFPLPNGNAYNQPAQWGNMLADNASTFIQSIEGPVPALSAASFGTQLLGAITTVLNVADAYNTCAP